MTSPQLDTPRREKTVLVVEDELLIALDLKGMLEAQGWRVLGPVANVQDALALLEAELPATALLDVNLGTELVTPVAERLRSLDVPFALTSAYDKPERYAGVVLAGVPNVGKPVTEKRVLATLDQLIGLDGDGT